MVNVALLSRWHVHADEYLEDLRACPGVRIASVWDEDAARGAEWAQALGVSFEPDLERLLARGDVDAVAICAPTVLHKRIVLAAANAKKHIFTEKVMALSVKDCVEMCEAIKSARIKFCISLPQRCLPANLYAKRIVDQGILGDITLLRARAAHGGVLKDFLPQAFYDEALCGGGAMIDLGAHPMYLSCWLLGKPAKIASQFSEFGGKGVDDNCVSAIQFENKAVAVSETSFVSSGRMVNFLEIHGTKGSLYIAGPDYEVRLALPGQKKPVERVVAPGELPEALPRPVVQWVEAIETGGPVAMNEDAGLELTELMEGAYIAYRQRRLVHFNEIAR